MKKIIYLFLIPAFIFSSCGNKNSKQTIPDEVKDTVNIVKINIPIEGMTCTGCEQTIQAKINELPGIKSAVASHCNKNAIVEYNPSLTDTSSIISAIKEAGYLPVFFNTNENDSITG